MTLMERAKYQRLIQVSRHGHYLRRLSTAWPSEVSPASSRLPPSRTNACIAGGHSALQLRCLI
jgi:hypothetical protein